MDSFRAWLEVTLYHGTVVDNEDGIRRYGLTPRTGDFVRSAYGDDYKNHFDGEHDAVYFADKADLGKATTAMVTAIAKKLSKYESDVTDTDIIAYGLLCVVEDPDRTTPQRDEDEEGHPQFVEPRDYYSQQTVRPNRIVKGQALVRLLKRYKAWPVTWTLKKLSGKENSYMRGKLSAAAIKQHADRTPDEVRKKVDSLPPTDAEVMFRTYRRGN